MASLRCTEGSGGNGWNATDQSVRSSEIECGGSHPEIRFPLHPCFLLENVLHLALDLGRHRYIQVCSRENLWRYVSGGGKGEGRCIKVEYLICYERHGMVGGRQRYSHFRVISSGGRRRCRPELLEDDTRSKSESNYGASFEPDLQHVQNSADLSWGWHRTDYIVSTLKTGQWVRNIRT